MTTAEQKEARIRARKRLRDDYEFYAPKCLKIRTKNETIEPLTFNAAQKIIHDAIEKQLAEVGYIRAVVLKGRQQGLSTYIGGRMYFTVSQRKASRAMVVAHKDKATSNLFEMTKRFHKLAPDAVRPSTSYSSKKELVFDKLDSAFTLATAGGDGIGRSETISQLHASEVAFWPKGTARDNWNSVTKCVPLAQGTAIYAESTANGVGDLFYDLWKGAVAGENGFIAIFIPWYIQEEYRAKAPANFERTPDEEELAAQFPLDDDQLWWRRMEIANTSLELFQQEYPCTPDEAFQTSGRPVFSSKQIAKRLEECPHPIRRLGLNGVDAGSPKWEDDVRGELYLYQEIDPAEEYTIGADVGGGVKGDPSVATVLNKAKEQVAVWQGTVLPDYYGHVLNHLGILFNYAHIGVESNNHGILPLHILTKDLRYPHVYQDTIYDSVNETETKRLGFQTNVKSKPMIIDKVRGEMRDGKLTLNHEKTLREMATFVVTESGRMEAQEGCHDDHVMALAIANHVHESGVGYVPVTEEHYVEAI